MTTQYEKYYEKCRMDSGKYLAMRTKGRTYFGYAVLTTKALEQLKPYAPFIEVGAGSGYWAYEFKKYGIKIVATDRMSLKKNTYRFSKQWTTVKLMTAKQAASKYSKHTLLMVWPSYNDPWAYEALKAYKGKTFVYCGEGMCGCTADDAFHELLQTKWKLTVVIDIPQWFGVHDSLEVYSRKDYS